MDHYHHSGSLVHTIAIGLDSQPSLVAIHSIKSLWCTVFLDAGLKLTVQLL